MSEGIAVTSDKVSKVDKGLDRHTCGIIMPISATANCPRDHWAEVLTILEEAKLVSDESESGIIQKRIVHNVYKSDVVVCDVSEKNPNVMFELGLRIAFDKPTIVIKDDKTDYSFDTSPIEHLDYPRDLRFGKMVEFKKELQRKMKASLEGNNEHSFLKSFGAIQSVKLESEDVSSAQYVLERLDELTGEIRSLRDERRKFASEEVDALINRALGKGRKTDNVVPPSTQLSPFDALIANAPDEWK